MSDFQTLVISFALVISVIMYGASSVDRAKAEQIKATVELAKINGCKPNE